MRTLATAGLILLAACALSAHAAPAFTEGSDYALLTPPQSTTVPAGKVEVMEVFSYACPACNAFQPVMERLRQSLPANAQLVYLPAAFNTAEDWPMFQRAYFAAQVLGVAERTHQGMFDAVWKGRELAISDPGSHALRSPLPSIEEAARWYAKAAGVRADEFLAAARSFGVDMKMKAADAQILAMQVPGTPCIVVNGRYRVNNDRFWKDPDGLIEVVKFLVSKDRAR